MTTPIKMIYCHDTLCGWCFGFIPTMEHFIKSHPDVSIDVLPGGLKKGVGVQPYSMMAAYISKAELNLTLVTGRSLGSAFREMINKEETPLTDSAPPSHAILQVKSIAPERAIEFAHLLQEEHFTNGKDLNDAQNYNEVCEKMGIPELDTQALLSATEHDPQVQESYFKVGKLGVSSFPTILVCSEQDQVLGTIDSVYDPDVFEKKFKEIVDAA